MSFKNKDENPNKIHKQYQHKHINARLQVDDIPVNNNIPGYEIEELMTLRERLNENKSKMDKFYIGSKTNPALSSKWNMLQTAVDLYKPMKRFLHDKYNAQLVTNAWLKYYEIYSQYSLIPEKNVLAFFNAELPGAALCAFNHYMNTMRPSVEFDWRASSLAPDNATGSSGDILGDYYGLYRQNKNKWLMQLKEDTTTARRNNGDATDIENLHDFAIKVGPKSKLGGVDIYSHDAGIDVSEGSDGGLGFNKQESANAKIHLGCALAGFMTLKIGGAFIAKQYTYFETFTWNLILIYASLFEDFYLCKPLTSRPYNSEIYLVGKGFKGMPANIEKLLVGRLQDFSMKPFIPKDGFKIQLQQSYSDLIRFARNVFGQQIQFIDENLKLFNQYGDNIKHLMRGLDWVKNERKTYWLQTYPVKLIDTNKWLPHIESNSSHINTERKSQDTNNL